MRDPEHRALELEPLEERDGRWQPADEHKPVATLHLPMTVLEFARVVHKLDELYPGCVVSTANGGVDVYAAPRTRPQPAPALRRPEVKQIRSDR